MAAKKELLTVDTLAARRDPAPPRKPKDEVLNFRVDDDFRYDFRRYALDKRMTLAEALAHLFKLGTEAEGWKK